ncbi:MAG: pilus (MSHA type) biogenesis protein MshL [Gammaproteobacteria bacterium]|nr:MAG: pilus (MSHA type) biogenesis protein MshL [Gammaproteobacteria bacterium]
MNICIKPLCILVITATLIACGPTRPPELSEGHINRQDVMDKVSIPAPVKQTTVLPIPKPRPKLETYTVVVNDVPVKELLFSMARDAKLNLDIHSDITGNVTLNAIDQTLPQILDRISKQADIRYEIEDGNLRVRADKPYLRTYKVDYVNLSRESKSTVRVATTLGSTGQGNIGETGSQSGGSTENNSSVTEVNNTSNNKFWDTLKLNIIAILKDDSNADAESAASEQQGNSKDVILNQESGIIAVRATHRQHEIVQAFLDEVLNNAKRQVMIEATIAEIRLSDRYQAGVDWSLIASDPTSGVSFTSDFRADNLANSPVSTLTIADQISGDPLNLTLRALEQFGDVQVLSTPKVMAINNQPAILKVVDNIVYFEMDVDTSTSQTTSVTTFETQIKTVPVGFVMSVTPFINDKEVVTLNIRPTISRVIDSVVDPNPEFKRVDVISEVPVIQVREIESVLQVNSGDTAIIGGLMQDTKNDNSNGVPFLSSLPFIGGLFSYEDDLREKSELVIFIRPVVVKHASLTGDFAEYQKYLPEKISNMAVTKE